MALFFDKGFVLVKILDFPALKAMIEITLDILWFQSLGDDLPVFDGLLPFYSGVLIYLLSIF